MDKFEEIWRIAATDLGLEIVTPFCLILPDKTELEIKVLLRGFGFQNGMLLTDDWQRICSYSDAIVDMGYGFSVLGPYSEQSMYDRETHIEMLSDWTWSGSETERPAWLLASSDGN